MSLTEEIRECTYYECLECGSVHKMYYMDGYYTCEECYRNVNIGDMEDLFVNWKKFRNLVANSTTPKKIIKILLNRIFHNKYSQEEIDKYYIDLMDNGYFSIKFE